MAWLSGLGHEERQAKLQEVMRLLEQGIMVPLSGKHFKLEQCKEAVDEVLSPGRAGKPLIVG